MAIISETNGASISGQEVGKEKVIEAGMILVNDCKQKVGASDADLEMIKKKQLPTTPEGICLVECMFNTVKIMKNGKFYKQGAIEVIEPALKKNQTKINNVRSMMDVCEKEIGDGDSDSCKTAKMIVDCMSKHSPEYGFVQSKIN